MPMSVILLSMPAVPDTDHPITGLQFEVTDILKTDDLDRLSYGLISFGVNLAVLSHLPQMLEVSRLMGYQRLVVHGLCLTSPSGLPMIS